MTITNPTPEARTALISRVRNILLKPKEEWVKIDTEAATVPGLYGGYIAILAAIPVLAQLIGGQVFGYGLFGITFRPPLVSALSGAVVQYVLTLVCVFLLALIIDFLAPSFDGQKNQMQALKLAAYTGTAGWLAGVFAIIPALSILSIVGLYSLYLLYTGLPVMMKSPAAKSPIYMGAIIVAGIIMGILVGVVTAVIVPHPSFGALGSHGTASGQLKLPNGAAVDVGALARAAQGLEAAANHAAATNNNNNSSAPSDTTTGSPADAAAGLAALTGGGSGVTAIDPEELKTVLPGGLPGGFQKGDVSSASGGAAGLAGSSAKAVYNKDDANLTVTVTDMGALGAMAALGGIMGAQSSEESPTHYSRMKQVDGRTTMEEYNSDSKSGTYSILVGNRIMVEVEGSNASMDEIKSAMSTIDLSSVQHLIK